MTPILGMWLQKSDLGSDEWRAVRINGEKAVEARGQVLILPTLIIPYTLAPYSCVSDCFQSDASFLILPIFSQPPRRYRTTLQILVDIMACNNAESATRTDIYPLLFFNTTVLSGSSLLMPLLDEKK